MKDDKLLIDRKFRTDYLAIALGVLSLLILAWIIFINSFVIFVVDGPSMQPNIQSGDSLLVRHNKVYSRGDTVVFYFEKEEIYLVKRVIATEGDTLRFETQGTVSSDTPVVLKLKKSGESEFSEPAEDFIKETMTKSHLSWKAVDFNTDIVVPKDCIFAMGDNRNISKDSRIIGFVALDAIAGEVKYCAEKGSFEESILKILYFASTEKKADNL